MSNDMSMFKKMKERITDEVNSATNKLQNMQIIDHLASTIGQQIKNEMAPNQLLPEPHNPQNLTKMPRNSQFSLMDDGPVSGYNEEEELNSELSPQHQLFNEHTIRRLNSPALKNDGTSLNNRSEPIYYQAVIDIQELSSDLEDGLDDTLDIDSKDDGLDVEIDLLSDKPVPNNTSILKDKLNKGPTSNYLSQYKTRYRNVVHIMRRLNQEFAAEKNKVEEQRREFANQISALKTELDNAKKHDSLLSFSTTDSENDKSIVGIPQPPIKACTKLKDLEKLLAKCKESLKLKNSQIQSLKDSLSEVDQFKDYNQELKRELGELREAHETWTVSIAENKRTMHQEIENRNAEMEKLKAETKDLKFRLADSHSKSKQLKGAIQDLESRVVSTSAAHQKERESLIKELTITKKNAIKQIQKEHDHNIERVKLDLEKWIEALKLEILNKDEQIIKNAEQQQQLHDKNYALATELEEITKKHHDQLKILDNSRGQHDREIKRCSDLNSELDSLKNLCAHQLNDLDSKSKEIDFLKEKLLLSEEIKTELEEKLNAIDASNKKNGLCDDLQKQISYKTERFQQELHELNAQLDLMTTANDDQEKEIKLLRSERDTLSQNYKSLKSEFDELLNKNESLSRVIRENEMDMQTQQEQLDHLIRGEQELDVLKKTNSSLNEGVTQLKVELSDRNLDFFQLRNETEKLKDQIAELKNELEITHKISEDLKKEKDSLIFINESSCTQKRELHEQLVLRILSTMKNLETPNTSPGSDKSYDTFQQESKGDNNKSLPDPITLMEELSSLALDRCNAYMTATQRLQAVLLENTMMGEELRRLKDELNDLNREKNLETQYSIEEAEKLHTENQALIHDQQSYDDRITSLEEEIETLANKLNEKKDKEDKANQTTNEIFANKEELKFICMSKEDEIIELKKILAVKEELEKNHLTDIEDNRCLLETYQLKIEDLDEKLNKLESDCVSKDWQLTQITEELKHLQKESNFSMASSQSSCSNANSTGFDSIDKLAIGRLEAEKVNLLGKIDSLKKELESQPSESTGDHTYQIRALQRVMQQYQEENQRLKESQKNLTAQIYEHRDTNTVPDSTEFEYLKNIVHQFMLGKEPLVLARVISAIFKFDKNQVEQICKIQEAVQTALKQSI